MKANDWEPILKLVISQNIGFDCASPGEIYKVLKLGASPTSIVFALPTKTAYQMTYAREAGVKHTTFDSSYELKKLKQYWPDAHLLIRIRVDGECIYKLGEKFGCDFETEAVALLEEAAALGLKVVGVAFHVGSACSSVDSHAIGLQRARKLFDHEARAGRQMKIVDIGGGFMSDRTDRVDKVAQQVNTALEEYFPERDVLVVAEPGRYVVDSAATLYNSINNIRRVTKDNKPVNMIYLNDGLHGSMRYAEPWTTVEKLSIGQKNGVEIDQEELEEAILWGPTCDSTDRIMEKAAIRLPRCSPFDWLVFKLQGAYTFVFHGPFSSIEIPLMRSVVSLELWNKIKDHPVFSPEDFVSNPDISAPLPSTLPPKIHRDQINGFNASLLDKV
ncbi:ornithine decarboxylase 2-like isoform X2 [Pectinophora gossypiella]|nr:ornithine decarboxylase 2-like isoform X2 [Pectinophora gossypiella]